MLNHIFFLMFITPVFVACLSLFAVVVTMTFNTHWLCGVLVVSFAIGTIGMGVTDIKKSDG